MESVWWVFKRLWDKGLVYQDVPGDALLVALSTSLSNFEAELGLPRRAGPRAHRAPCRSWATTTHVLLIWTTTPWTLPSNLAVAVGAEHRYVRAKARRRRPRLHRRPRARPPCSAKTHEVVGEGCRASGLVGKTYAPLFPYFADVERTRFASSRAAT
jgi:isoleucyl-tRNA synthetase